MGFSDGSRLLHPVFAIVIVFPLIGMVINFAWQTRQRRLQLKVKEKSKISPVVSKEHVALGRWLVGAVITVALLGMGHPIIKTILKKHVLSEDPGKVIGIIVLLAITLVTLGCLYKARTRLGRGLFGSFATIGLWSLGAQDGVYRSTAEWQTSHYYYGMTATTLLIFSLAILPEIYTAKIWRQVHIGLNCIALLFFVIQALTGTRDLLEIPLSWQAPYIYSCDALTQTCPK